MRCQLLDHVKSGIDRMILLKFRLLPALPFKSDQLTSNGVLVYNVNGQQRLRIISRTFHL